MLVISFKSFWIAGSCISCILISKTSSLVMAPIVILQGAEFPGSVSQGYLVVLLMSKDMFESEWPQNKTSLLSSISSCRCVTVELH